MQLLRGIKAGCASRKSLIIGKAGRKDRYRALIRVQQPAGPVIGPGLDTGAGTRASALELFIEA